MEIRALHFVLDVVAIIIALALITLVADNQPRLFGMSVDALAGDDQIVWRGDGGVRPEGSRIPPLR